VGRTVFWPAPNVDSGLVSWTRREPPSHSATREQVFRVVDAAFAQRRKTLRSTLKAMAGSPEAAVAALAHAGVDPMARGESIGVADFARIAEGLIVGLAAPGAGR
jgi:16S rRNA (adenine1518-N6/adenine1519-N6)-dimethyltransferase